MEPKIQGPKWYFDQDFMMQKLKNKIVRQARKRGVWFQNTAGLVCPHLLIKHNILVTIEWQTN